MNGHDRSGRNLLALRVMVLLLMLLRCSSGFLHHHTLHAPVSSSVVLLDGHCDACALEATHGLTNDPDVVNAPRAMIYRTAKLLAVPLAISDRIVSAWFRGPPVIAITSA
jgi:hypothetical protein